MAEVSAQTGIAVDCPAGTMIELPRAALTAGRIAREAAFFSCGTHDPTQATRGFSRDDVEAAFSSACLDEGNFKVSPFETIDREGVGRPVGIAEAEGRAARPDLKIGVCGEHGGDPDSCTSSTTRDRTTSPAPRSVSRSPVWRRAGRHSRTPRAATAGEVGLAVPGPTGPGSPDRKSVV